MKVLLGISGASGAVYGVRTGAALAGRRVDLHLVVTHGNVFEQIETRVVGDRASKDTVRIGDADRYTADATQGVLYLPGDRTLTTHILTHDDGAGRGIVQRVLSQLGWNGFGLDNVDAIG